MICYYVININSKKTQKLTAELKQKKCVSTMHIWQMLGCSKNYMQHPAPFQRQHFSRSLHASIYSTQGIENNVSARLPNITSARRLWPPVTLTFDLLTSKVDHSCPRPRRRFRPIRIEIGASSMVFRDFSSNQFFKKLFASLHGQHLPYW